MQMRVWDIHPGYLSRQSLWGEHSEIHALYNIITKNRRGFSNHPETKRWNGHLDLLVLRHNLLVKEITIRGFKHCSPLVFIVPIEERKGGQLTPFSYVDIPSLQFDILHRKYQLKGQKGRIPLPAYSTEFWAHHKYSIMARGYQYYKEIQHFLKNRKNLSISEDNDLVLKVLDLLKKPISRKALENVILHLWGYFKNIATSRERNNFLNLSISEEKMRFLYLMSKKYQKLYLIHSTIFADFLID